MFSSGYLRPYGQIPLQRRDTTRLVADISPIKRLIYVDVALGNYSRTVANAKNHLFARQDGLELATLPWFPRTCRRQVVTL